jgi:hypothetical protein
MDDDSIRLKSNEFLDSLAHDRISKIDSVRVLSTALIMVMLTLKPRDTNFNKWMLMMMEYWETVKDMGITEEEVQDG